MAALALAALSSATTLAAVTEPPIPPAATGESVPEPSPAGALSILTSRGFSQMDGTLQGLFMTRGETIDVLKDAQTTPGTFSPACDFTVQLVLHAGGCPIGIGWHNVTSGNVAPPQDQIYPLVPASFPKCPPTIDPAVACCDDVDFCPLATYDTTQMPQHRWNMPAYSADAIRSDSRYLGGQIGFVLMGASGADGRCNQNKYSQLELNQRAPDGQPWVGALVYRSTADPASYYVAFDAQATSASSWRGQNNSGDGTFNDFVLFVKSATCGSGGSGAGTGGTAGAGSGGAAGGGNGGHAAAAGGGGGGNAAADGGSGVGGGASAGNGGESGAAGGAAGSGLGASGAVGSGGRAATGSGGIVASGGVPSSAGSGGAIGAAGGNAGTQASSGSKSGCTYVATDRDGGGAALATVLMLSLTLRARRRRR